MVFFAEFFLCLNWAPVAAMLLVCVYVCVCILSCSLCIANDPRQHWVMRNCYIGCFSLQYTIIPERRSTAEAVQILISHLLGDAISPAIVGGVSACVGKKLQFNHLLLSLWQISDTIYNHIKLVHTEYAGRAISTEFALFTTAIVCVLGGSAFLASSLTVEADRKVHKKSKTPPQLSLNSGWGGAVCVQQHVPLLGLSLILRPLRT